MPDTRWFLPLGRRNPVGSMGDAPETLIIQVTGHSTQHASKLDGSLLAQESRQLLVCWCPG